MPTAIFWVNAAEPLAQGLALIGARLRPEVRGEPPDRQLQVAFEELSQRPDALLVFDNLDDPAQLTRPVGSEPSPLTLGCRILFTTRQRELGRFHPIEVFVLPEEPALQLLLRHESRHPVRDDPDHPERPEAEAIVSPARVAARSPWNSPVPSSGSGPISSSLTTADGSGMRVVSPRSTPRSRTWPRSIFSRFMPLPWRPP